MATDKARFAPRQYATINELDAIAARHVEEHRARMRALVNEVIGDGLRSLAENADHFTKIRKGMGAAGHFDPDS